MAGSPDFSEFSGEKLPEKTTCSLLSQYLKENGSLGDLSLEMTANDEGNTLSEMYHQRVSPMRFFPFSDKPSEFSAQNNPISRYRNLRPMNLFPQDAGFGPAISKEHVNNSSETERAQMTIFYGGEVIVLDDFPADKAKEVMLMAGKSSSHGVNPFGTKFWECQPPIFAHPTFHNSAMEQKFQPYPPHLIACDLPIARKASLKRFFEKRKDRIISVAPYQLSNSPVAKKPVPNKQWLGLARQ